MQGFTDMEFLGKAIRFTSSLYVKSHTITLMYKGKTRPRSLYVEGGFVYTGLC